jgi:RNA polymerase subunit RPABC4/transcription elongation factor Spt4
MGVWGEGNFSNDGALDYVGTLVQQLVVRVQALFASEYGADLDELGESELMPSVEIISVLCEHCNAVPPRASVVKRWRERYLRIYDEQIEMLDPDAEFKTKRRRVIEATFGKLERQAHLFYAGVSRELILCPYCVLPIGQDTTLCPTCGEDTTKDAAFEMTVGEYHRESRKPCVHCGQMMLRMAVMCPACRRWQRDG